ncbi:MAG TPA: hypothetical protein VII12_14805 [Thermoanaerobaculia bacterium]|jgi:hypothetical protein
MSRAAVSIFVFGCYILLNAVTLIAAPDLLLGTLRLPPTHEPWLRVFGAVIFVLALYYIQAARQEVTPFFRWTTWGRPLLFLGLVILAAVRLVPPIVIVFGVIDVAGAAWTAIALRSPRMVAT